MNTPNPLTRREMLAALGGLLVAGSATSQGTVQADQLPDFGPAPEFVGIERWFNSEPLTMQALRGRVVLIDFWTYACINCVRTLPHINRWARTYTPEGLTLVGVHTPEFPFERPARNVEGAMRRYGVEHPVAQDNRYATWKAYNNQYWPATYLIDVNGRIRYKHFGEGEYERTESVIRALLAQRR